MLHVCCFVWQHPVSLLYNRCVQSSTLGSWWHTWLLRAASFSVSSTTVMFHWASSCFCDPLQRWPWVEDLPPSSSSSSSSCTVPGFSTADSSPLPPANHRLRSNDQTQAGRQEVGRTLSTWDTAVLEVFPFNFFFFSTPKRRMWQNRRAFWEAATKWSHDINR